MLTKNLLWSLYLKFFSYRMQSLLEIVMALGASYATETTVRFKVLVITYFVFSLGRKPYPKGRAYVFFASYSAHCPNCFLGVILILPSTESWKWQRTPSYCLKSLRTKMIIYGHCKLIKNLMCYGWTAFGPLPFKIKPIGVLMLLLKSLVSFSNKSSHLMTSAVENFIKVQAYNFCIFFP